MNVLPKIINQCRADLPFDKKSKPWTYVNHGVDLLQDDDELNCYLAAYGGMHEEKIHSALSGLSNLGEISSNSYQIIDWGCGQGLASLCFLDFIKENGINNKPDKIVLIEPSEPAISRAKSYIDEYFGSEVETVLITKKINDVNSDDIKTKHSTTINFFSNILDIHSVDLNQLSDLIKKHLKGEQYFICVGPLNFNSTRIDEFAQLLNFTEEEIIKSDKGRLKKNRGTIKLLVFKITGEEIKIIKSIYYPPMPKKDSVLIELQKKLNEIDPSGLSYNEKLLEYYKLVVEIEQLKEPKIDKFHEYEFETDNTNEIIIDLESNNRFLNIFNENRSNRVRWPKNLTLSIVLLTEENRYPFLSYTFMYDDIKDINVEEENIRIKLSQFELNYSTLAEFERTEDQIDKLENLVKQADNIEDILKILDENLEYNLEFDNKISLALSTKNPAQLQILSELRRIEKLGLSNKGLLNDFLSYSSFENKFEELKKDDLVNFVTSDDSQTNAVLASFSNKLTVITGPPGSGKTQVITNILGNSILNGKKVLVASKNNKAVDNVKDKFDEIDDTGFFLRFGSKQKLREKTLPEIERIRNIKNELEDNEYVLDDIRDEMNSFKDEKVQNQIKLDNKSKFISEVRELKRSNKKTKEEIERLKEENTRFESFRNNSELNDIDKVTQDFKRAKNLIEMNYYGLKKIWFDLFNKKKQAFHLLDKIECLSKSYREYLSSLEIAKEIQDLKNGSIIINNYNKIITALESYINYISNYEALQNKLRDNKDQLEKLNDKIAHIQENESNIKEIILKCEKEINSLNKQLLKEKIKNKLYESRLADINNYKNYLPDNIPWKNEELDEFKISTDRFLDVFNITCVTSLSAKACLPLETEIYDMVIIDEASQCDIASAIPLILRAKQLVVIGDPLQLKHITSLNDYEETKIKEHLGLTKDVHLKYKYKSLWHYCHEFLAKAESNKKVINLNRHYRSHKEIIGYSKDTFYLPKLKLDLKICTNANQFKIKPKGIIWENVNGTQTDDKNINIDEAKKSIEIASNVLNANRNISVGIVTPFRAQADELKKRVNNDMPGNLADSVIADTVHAFQGDQKDIMIYSLVVTDNSPDSKIYWINNIVPESVNVAVTRARNTLYIVGNKNYIRRKSNTTEPLRKLLSYTEDLQKLKD